MRTAPTTPVFHRFFVPAAPGAWRLIRGGTTFSSCLRGFEHARGTWIIELRAHPSKRDRGRNHRAIFDRRPTRAFATQSGNYFARATFRSVRGFHHAQRKARSRVIVSPTRASYHERDRSEERNKNQLEAIRKETRKQTRKERRQRARRHVRAAVRALDFISHQAFLLAVSDTEKARIWLRSRQKIRRKQVCS